MLKWEKRSPKIFDHLLDILKLSEELLKNEVKSIEEKTEKIKRIEIMRKEFENNG